MEAVQPRRGYIELESESAEPFECPMLRRGIRLGEHQAVFKFHTTSTAGKLRYAFCAQDTNNYYFVEIRWDGNTVKTDPNGGTSFTDTQFTEDGSTSAVSVTHDKAGNMKCDPPSPSFGEAGGLHTYVYDAWNRLAKVKRAGSQDGLEQHS